MVGQSSNVRVRVILSVRFINNLNLRDFSMEEETRVFSSLLSSLHFLVLLNLPWNLPTQEFKQFAFMDLA